MTDKRVVPVDAINTVRGWVGGRGHIMPNGLVAALIEVLDYAAAPAPSPVEPEAITTLRQAAIEAAEYLEWLAGTRPEVAVERQLLIAIDFAANLRNALEVSGG